jgi:hypothetical protein
VFGDPEFGVFTAAGDPEIGVLTVAGDPETAGDDPELGVLTAPFPLSGILRIASLPLPGPF